MRYLNTDFNKSLLKLTKAKFKKHFEDHNYKGDWEEAWKAIGGKTEKPKND